MPSTLQLRECDSQKPQLNLQLILLALALAAVVSAMSPFIDGKSHILVCIFVLTFLFGCCKTRRSVLFVLPALYLPFAWWLLAGGKLDYAKLSGFWYSPGLSLASMLWANPSDWRQALGILITLTIFFGAVMLGRASSLAAAVVGLNLFCLAWLVGSVPQG